MLTFIEGKIFMSLNILLKPAISIMNKLSFKTKILVSIAILFLIFLFPSKTLFFDYMQKSNRYDKQLIGLKYIEAIHEFIRTVQLHRSASIDYLQGNREIQEDLKDLESRFYHQRKEIMDFDTTHLNILSSEQNFAKALALFELMKLDKFNDKTSVDKVYIEHGKIVDRLVKAIKEVASVSNFARSKDLRINYLASMLQEKLLRLYETTRELKDTTQRQINSGYALKSQKLILYTLNTDLSSLKDNLKENKLLSELENYHSLEELATAVIYNITELLEILDKNILSGNQQIFLEKELFLKKATEGIELQDRFYNRIIYTYENTIKNLKAELKGNEWSLFLALISILAFVFYIIIAFYQSITGNLKKLQTASELISTGQTKIKLEVDKPDEIGDALIAFNTMSEKLTENIAFLDGYKKAIDKSSIVSKTDTHGIITYVNKMFCNVSGYSEEELLGRSHNIVRHPDVPSEVFKDMWDTIQSKKVWKGVIKNRRKDGSAYIVQATITPILDSDNNILEYVAVRHDITELEESKEEIKKQRTDFLTGLPNRQQLLVDLKSAVKPIMFYLNIDDFSGFNDFYGSAIGDSVLINLANRLSELREKEEFKLYKLQSDQFILLFEDEYLAEKNLKNYFIELVGKIEEDISNINLENQNRISISVSGGVATYYDHDNYQNLILYANIARKKAKEKHKKFLLFDHSMRKSEDYAKNIEWIKRIKEAIDDDRIVTYFQPILDNKTEKVNKYETLVRMLDRDGDPVPTWTFLEIAQKAKLYSDITRIVIDKAFKKFENVPEIEFSINLTIDDILSKTTTTYIFNKLESYSHPNRVIFEITESEEVSDYKIINDFIKEVKKYGVKIAIDDFGSGYANFEHIINIDAEYIKIDGTLIKNIDTDPNAKIITEAIIEFSRKLGRKTITEFIHSEEIYQIVKDLGADYSQGFYLGVPLPELV